jgi:hypothetical protein
VSSNVNSTASIDELAHRHRDYRNKYSITRNDLTAHKFPSSINQNQLSALLFEIFSLAPNKIFFDNGGFAEERVSCNNNKVIKVEGLGVTLLPEIVRTYEIYWKNKFNEKEGLEVVFTSEMESNRYAPFALEIRVIGSCGESKEEIAPSKFENISLYLSEKQISDKDIFELIKTEIDDLMNFNDIFWVEQGLYQDEREWHFSKLPSNILDSYYKL